MSKLHDLIKLQRQVDNLERHALTVFGTHKMSEVQQLTELKKSLWARIEGEIDTEREQAREASKSLHPDILSDYSIEEKEEFLREWGEDLAS
jgi:hypothetical protein